MEFPIWPLMFKSSTDHWVTVELPKRLAQNCALWNTNCDWFVCWGLTSELTLCTLPDRVFCRRATRLAFTLSFKSLVWSQPIESLAKIFAGRSYKNAFNPTSTLAEKKFHNKAVPRLWSSAVNISKLDKKEWRKTRKIKDIVLYSNRAQDSQVKFIGTFVKL